MTAVLHNSPGRIGWDGTRDAEGHREYKLRSLVRADVADGPAIVMSTPGLPAIGSFWSVGNETDTWAVCTPRMTAKHHKPPRDGGPHKYWEVEQTFTTKPGSRCQDTNIEDPLLEPQRISGSFVKYTQEVTRDKDDNALLSSSHEHLRGSEVEFDFNRPTVRIEQNVASLGLALFSQMVDTVNGTALWGLGTRRIKLSNVSWERKIQGTCSYYYTRAFDFDIDFNTFDRVALDKGSKALGGWKKPITTPPVWEVTAGLVNTNPLHFTRYKDARGELAIAMLDGTGEPIENNESPAEINVQYYQESNFLLLGIPTVIGG